MILYIYIKSTRLMCCALQISSLNWNRTNRSERKHKQNNKTCGISWPYDRRWHHVYQFNSSEWAIQPASQSSVLRDHGVISSQLCAHTLVCWLAVLLDMCMVAAGSNMPQWLSNGRRRDNKNASRRKHLIKNDYFCFHTIYKCRIGMSNYYRIIIIIIFFYYRYNKRLYLYECRV